MKSPERKTLHKCFDKTKKLFETKRAPEDWADNIIKGSEGLLTKCQWKHYYAWLANPNNYDEDQTESLTIEPQVSENIHPYPANMTVETIKNGPCQTFIRVTNNDGCESEEKTLE